MDFIGDYTGHVDHENYKYSSVFTSKIPGTELQSIHILDYTITNPDKIENFIPGKTFLAPVVSNYYHAMVDVVGTYEFLKSVYPDIKIIFCIKDTRTTSILESYKKSMEDTEHNITKTIQEIYNLKNFTVSFVDDHTRFEEVIFMPTRSVWDVNRPTPLKIQDELFTFSHEDLLPIRIEYMKKLKEKFLPLINVKDEGKIYCSRMPYDESDPEFINFVEPVINENNSDRIYDERDIIKYFKSIGYRIINSENFSMLEQFSIFAGATHVAGINGSNMFNCIFMKENSPVFIIDTQRWWGYEFIKYLQDFNLSVYSIGNKTVLDIPAEKGVHAKQNILLSEIKEYQDEF
jgi:hypothetical protein